MGVKHFFIWYRNNFSSCTETLVNPNTFKDINIYIDNLALDLNGLFHSCAQKVYEYGNHRKPISFLKKQKKTSSLKLQMKLFKDICDKIEYYRKLVNPRKRLILCVDGVAGSAKMIQQRQRRFKAVKDIDKFGENDFDSNCLTPGTKFMDFLTKYIDWYIKIMVSHFPDWQNIEVIFSNEKAEGEGEHKILNYIRKYDYNTESYCIHGLDADLIMLSLGTNIDNIYILRENIYNYNENLILNIGKFRKELVNHLKWDGEERFNSKQAIDDFIFICFLVGNDFLPNIPTLAILEGGIEIMIDIYKNIGPTYGHLTRENIHGNIVFKSKSLEPFIGTLTQYETGILEEKVNKAESFIPDKLLNKHTNLTENKLVVDFEKYKEEYYQKKFPENTKIKDICHSYFKGLQWVISYYKKGMTDWEWFYKFHYAPFTIDLVKNIRSFKYVKPESTKSIDPFLQLLTVIPPKSSKLLPNPLNTLLTNSDSVIKKFCPDEFEIDCDGKRKEWEGIVIIPMVDMNIFKEIYDSNLKNINEKDQKRNIKGKSFKYTYDDDISYYFKSYYGDISSCKVKNIIFDM